jgi:hypothetical protein
MPLYAFLIFLGIIFWNSTLLQIHRRVFRLIPNLFLLPLHICISLCKIIVDCEVEVSGITDTQLTGECITQLDIFPPSKPYYVGWKLHTFCNTKLSILGRNHYNCTGRHTSWDNLGRYFFPTGTLCLRWYWYAFYIAAVKTKWEIFLCTGKKNWSWMVEGIRGKGGGVLVCCCYCCCYWGCYCCYPLPLVLTTYTYTRSSTKAPRSCSSPAAAVMQQRDVTAADVATTIHSFSSGELPQSLVTQSGPKTVEIKFSVPGHPE